MLRNTETVSCRFKHLLNNVKNITGFIFIVRYVE